VAEKHVWGKVIADTNIGVKEIHEDEKLAKH
jgi:hypothetical protein